MEETGCQGGETDPERSKAKGGELSARPGGALVSFARGQELKDSRRWGGALTAVVTRQQLGFEALTSGSRKPGCSRSCREAEVSLGWVAQAGGRWRGPKTDGGCSPVAAGDMGPGGGQHAVSSLREPRSHRTGSQAKSGRPTSLRLLPPTLGKAREAVHRPRSVFARSQPALPILAGWPPGAWCLDLQVWGCQGSSSLFHC